MLRMCGGLCFSQISRAVCLCPSSRPCCSGADSAAAVLPVGAVHDSAAAARKYAEEGRDAPEAAAGSAALVEA